MEKEKIKERINVIKKKAKNCSDYQCDLCDKTRYPMISWRCTHDDDYIKTIVCLPCIIILRDVIPDGFISVLMR